MTYEETFTETRIFRYRIQVDSKSKIIVKDGDSLQSTETAKKIYRELFARLRNEKDWRGQTQRISVKTSTEATLIAEALSYFLGGAEVATPREGEYCVGSQGYYHYMKHVD